MLRRFHNKRALKKLEPKKSIQSILEGHQKAKKTPPLFKGAKIASKKINSNDKNISTKLFKIKNNLKKMERARKAGQLVLSIALMLSVFYLLFLSPVFMIEDVVVYQTTMIETEEGQEFEREILDNPQINNLLSRYEGRNLVLLNIASVESVLNKRIANLEDLYVRKAYPSTLEIDFKQFDKVVNLVNLVGPGKIQKDSVLDENGRVAEVGSKRPELPIIRIQSDEPYEKGDQVIKIPNLNYILGMIEYFEKEFDMSVIDITYLVEAREVHIYTDRRFMIWIDIQRDYKEQLTKLKNAIPKINPYEQEFEYIDLRIESQSGQKIFYKLK